MILGKEFENIGFCAFKLLGFGGYAPTIFPSLVLQAIGDDAPDVRPMVEEHLDEIIDNLTKWKPEVGLGRVVPEEITVTGRDDAEVVANMNNHFIRNLWSEGWPLTPPTEEKVKWILTGTSLDRDEVIGKIPPMGGIATVEKIAVNLAMVGGRPEYLPVLIAAIRVLTRDIETFGQSLQTTNAVTPAIIVNGPIAKQIRINCGDGVMGPSEFYPAGAVLGRALRSVFRCVGGVATGFTAMSVYGNPARYGALFMAEDEEKSPWSPLSVDMGLPSGTNAVTAMPTTGNMVITMNPAGISMERYMDRIADWLKYPTANYYTDCGNGEPKGAILITAEHAEVLANSGLTKESFKEGLMKRMVWSADEFRRNMPPQVTNEFLAIRCPQVVPLLEANSPSIPLVHPPDELLVIVAGGPFQIYLSMLEVGWGFKGTQKVEDLPSNWDELIKQAEEDLGPVPTVA